MYALTEQETSSNAVSVKTDYLIIEGPKIHHLFTGKFKIGKANLFTDLFIYKISNCTADLGLEDITNNQGDIKHLQQDQYEDGELCILISVLLQPKNSYYLFGV